VFSKSLLYNLYFRLKNILNKASLIALGHINSTGLIEVTVQAQDAGEPALSSQQKILLRLVSSTDVTPVFDRSAYFFNVSQEAEIGDEVGEVRAVSKSGSSVLTYRFKSTQTYFTVHSNNVCDGVCIHSVYSQLENTCTMYTRIC
jgi:hypothetical protein